MNYQRTTFSEIKHLLPPDAWAAWRNEVNKGEFEAESVLFFENSAMLPELNLDTPFEESESVFLVLVQGSLTVQRFIYNENIDGATGLIVLGNLCANMMLVGGQEIYVTGNLVVEELFWGDYNHGNLRVLGNANVNVLAAVDYDVLIEGEAAIKVNLTPGEGDTNWQDLDVALVQKTLIEEAITIEAIALDEEDEEMDEEVTLHRDEAMVARLRAGKSLLKG